MRDSQHPQLPPNRPPLADTTRRVNNFQPSPARPSKIPVLVRNGNTRNNDVLIVPNPQGHLNSPRGLNNSEEDYTLITKSNGMNPRLRTLSKHSATLQSKRDSQISTTSTGSDSSKRIKATIGPWKLGKTLGKGATARVRQARHVVTGQEAAIKIVQKRNAQISQAGSLAAFDKAEADVSNLDQGFRRMPVGIEREVAIMKLIQHPNILKLYDIWENHTEIYLVLEYVDNGELFDHISRNGRLEEEEAMKYFRQMLSAIGCCHSFNICHRDLKPENILLTKDLNIKIADFGMAALHQGPGHKLKTSCGSPHYAAPELIRGASYRGDRVDIWSMGVILYATLAGRLPFDVEIDEKGWLQKLLLKIKKGSFQMMAHFTPEATDLIQRILQVNPNDRITLLQIWDHPLLRKYDYLDNYGGGRVANSPDIKQCGSAIYRRADIDRDLLHNLRSMWYTLKEDDLMKKLLSKRPNEQKVFFGLLLQYKEAQLENYVPYLECSNSDYHHAKPLGVAKAFSTSRFPLLYEKGHGRQMSTFTIISNAAATERSYDPFKLSRPRLVQQSIESNGNNSIRKERRHTRDHCIGSPQVSMSSILLSTTAPEPSSCPRELRRLRVPIQNQQFPTQASLANSNHSINSAVRVRAAVGHRRRISFQQIRCHSSCTEAKYSLGTQSSQIKIRHSNNTEITDDGGDTLRAVSPIGNQECFRPPGEHDLELASFLSSRVALQTRELWKEDMRRFSRSLARSCDEAFNRSSIISTDTTVGYPQTTESSTPSIEQSYMVNDGQHSTVHRSFPAFLNTRPLPPPPKCSESVRLELEKAREEAELRRLELRRLTKKGGSAHYLDQMVTHIDNLMQSGSFLGADNLNYRNFSAQTEPGYVRTRRGLHPIQEMSPVKSKDQRAVSCPFSHIPVKDKSYHKHEPEVEDVFHVIGEVPQLDSVKIPAPLTIRKLKARVHPPPFISPTSAESSNNSCDEPINGGKVSHKHTLNTVERRGKICPDGRDHCPLTNDKITSSVSKTPHWLKRNSKFSIHDKDGILAEAKPVSVSSSVGKNNEETSVETSKNKKKRLGLGRLFKRKKNKNELYIFEENSSVSETSTSYQDYSDGAPEAVDSNTVRARQIEPQQSWIARLFHIKPACGYICMTLSKRQARREITQVLKQWKQYGIRDIQTDKERNIVFGRVDAKNYLGIKEVSFAGEIMTVVEHGRRSHLSIARFTQERGAASSFYKVVETMEMVLKCRGFLVADGRKKMMMMETLRAA